MSDPCPRSCESQAVPPVLSWVTIYLSGSSGSRRPRPVAGAGMRPTRARRPLLGLAAWWRLPVPPGCRHPVCVSLALYGYRPLREKAFPIVGLRRPALRLAPTFCLPGRGAQRCREVPHRRTLRHRLVRAPVGRLPAGGRRRRRGHPPDSRKICSCQAAGAWPPAGLQLYYGRPAASRRQDLPATARHPAGPGVLGVVWLRGRDLNP